MRSELPVRSTPLECGRPLITRCEVPTSSDEFRATAEIDPCVGIVRATSGIRTMKKIQLVAVMTAQDMLNAFIARDDPAAEVATKQPHVKANKN